MRRTRGASRVLRTIAIVVPDRRRRDVDHLGNAISAGCDLVLCSCPSMVAVAIRPTIATGLLGLP
jgi:hypothetical protein